MPRSSVQREGNASSEGVNLVIRNIVKIDEAACDGCGQCVPNCAEGALQVIDGKVRLVKDEYCDGLGACLGHCPRGAITIIQREADPFDDEAVHRYPARKKAQEGGCPSSEIQRLEHSSSDPIRTVSALGNWPVQLNLVPLEASFFDNAKLLMVADCVPFAYPNLHGSLLQGRTVLVGCPKFDDAHRYAEKLGEILKRNNIKSIDIAHMEVPCCSALNWIVKRGLEASGRDIPVRRHVITIKGEIK